MNLDRCLKQIKEASLKDMELARSRWNQLAKPLHGLGRLEEEVIRLAGIVGADHLQFDKKAVIVMCADHGVVEEGVTQTDSSVTAVVADNFTRNATTACIMAKRAGADVFPVDIGVKTKTLIYTEKICCGTKNMTKEPAMSREEAVQALEVGIRQAVRLKEMGYQMLATGEMGIGNTTASSAVVSVLMDLPAKMVTGRGAGLSEEGLVKKQKAIEAAVKKNNPERQDPVDVLSKVGGFDIAGMAGVFLGGAALGIPVVMDGYISAAAALIAYRLSKDVRDYIIPSHQSREPGMQKILEELRLTPYLDCRMSLGEGTGAIAAMPLLDMALAVYHDMRTFEEIAVTPYEELGGNICGQ